MKRTTLTTAGIFFAILQTSAANAANSWDWEFPVYVGAKYTHTELTANNEKANVGLLGATVGFNHNDYISSEVDFQTSVHDEQTSALGKVDVSRLVTASLNIKYPLDAGESVNGGSVKLVPNLKLGVTKARLKTGTYGENARSEFSWGGGFDLLVGKNTTINVAYVNYMNTTVDGVDYDFQGVQVGYSYRF